MSNINNKHIPEDLDSLTRKDMVELFKIQVEEHQGFIKEIESLRAQLAKANERVKELLSLLREMSIDYECDIRHKYSGLIDTPSERPVTRRAFESDMEIIVRVNEQLRKEQE